MGGEIVDQPPPSLLCFHASSLASVDAATNMLTPTETRTCSCSTLGCSADCWAGPDFDRLRRRHRGKGGELRRAEMEV